eukprot:6211848-Prymnesium_polylepis.1
MGWPGDKPPVDEMDRDPNKRTHLAFGSKFAIFIEPETGFDGKLPVVGAVVSGLDVVTEMAKTPVNKRKEPETVTGLTIDVEIADCGQLPEEDCRSRDEADRAHAAAMAPQAGPPAAHETAAGVEGTDGAVAIPIA